MSATSGASAGGAPMACGLSAAAGTAARRPASLSRVLGRRRDRAADAKAVRERLGLSRKGIEAAAKTHIEASGWMRDHLTKAIGLHVADEVWQRWTGMCSLMARATARTATDRLVVGVHPYSGAGPFAHEGPASMGDLAASRHLGRAPGHLSLPELRAAVRTGSESAERPGSSILAQPARLTVPARPPLGVGRSSRGVGGSVHRPAQRRFGAAGAATSRCGPMGAPVPFPGRPARLAQDRPGTRAGPQSARRLAVLRPSTRPTARLSVPGHPRSSRRDPRRSACRSGCQCVQPVDCVVSREASRPVGGRPDLLDRRKADRRGAGGQDKPELGTRPWIGRGVTPTPTSTSRRRGNTSGRNGAPRKGWPPVRSPTRAGRGMPAPMGCRCGPTATTSSHTVISAPATITPARRGLSVKPNMPAPARSPRGSWPPTAVRSPLRTVRSPPGPACGARGFQQFSPGMLVTALTAECAAAGGRLHRIGTHSTALSQHCLCGTRVPKTLAQRTHKCPHCGLYGDRDIVSAILACCVTLADPDDPATARVDYRLALALRASLASQQEWEGSVNRHQPPRPSDGVGLARTGSHRQVASAEQAALGPPPNSPGPAWTSRDQPKQPAQADWRCMTE